MKKVLFIDRDGTLVIEPPIDYQLDSLEKLEFYPGVFRYLSMITEYLDYELVLVSNQDGLGTSSFPEETFWPVHGKIIKALQAEGIVFSEELIDRSFDHENKPGRKPGIAMMGNYISGNYDLKNSFVIGDRVSDMEFAKNLGCKGILLNTSLECKSGLPVVLETENWCTVYEYLRFGLRKAELVRNTKETQISLQLNLDGKGQSNIETGIAFFDHMLDQICRHSLIDIELKVAGDLEVDEHHTVEDVGLVLGEAFNKALGGKQGLQRYGFCLPMDDCLARVAIDFGGRNYLVWDAKFNREMIGKMPTEMFPHFFKSFTDGAKCNLNVKAEGVNEHHKIEAVFKAFAKAIKMAIGRDSEQFILPSTKGLLT